MIDEGRGETGVITTGLAFEYYRENLAELADKTPHHSILDRYPMPHAAVRELARRVKRIVVLEEGYPFVERRLRGILPTGVAIIGKESGEVPRDGRADAGQRAGRPRLTASRGAVPGRARAA